MYSLRHFLRITIILVFQICSLFVFAQNGKEIFWQNCASCHTIGKGKLIGPDLNGVENRHSKAWFYKWISSPQAMIQAGDTSAVRLFVDNNKIMMPDQDLTKEQIAEVLKYIHARSVVVEADSSSIAEIKRTAQRNSNKINKNDDESSNSNLIWIAWVIIVLLLIIWVVRKF